MCCSPVLPGWNCRLPERSAAKKLGHAALVEHLIYPMAVRWFVEGDLLITNDGLVRHKRGMAQLFCG